MTVPLDPADCLTAGTDTFTYDNASQVNSTGYAHDNRGRQTASPGNGFTWDGASRLTGINGVALAYNGLNDLVTRTEGGSSLHYYYNYAIGMKPIVGEQDETNGQFLRYYVWTPDGRLLYMIDAADGNKVYFYYFDRMGSTLALTDAAGNVTDSYAYTPYGKLLQHNGSSAQPFTFIGQWGVRQEGAGGELYHMRERYYDAHTAAFVSRDPVWPGLSDAQSLNTYQYAKGNPRGYIDPMGTSPRNLKSLLSQKVRRNWSSQTRHLNIVKLESQSKAERQVGVIPPKYGFGVSSALQPTGGDGKGVEGEINAFSSVRPNVINRSNKDDNINSWGNLKPPSKEKFDDKPGSLNEVSGTGKKQLRTPLNILFLVLGYLVLELFFLHP
jgi:RHS repeat-associated protein